MPGSLCLVNVTSSVIIHYNRLNILKRLQFIVLIFLFLLFRRPLVRRPKIDHKINQEWCCIRRREVTTASEERGRRPLAATQKDLLRCGQVSDVE